MSRTRKTALIAIALSIFTGLAVWAWYKTFLEGTTDGPDVIKAIQSGEVSADSISSIEVVEPTVGRTPFTAEEYDGLSRRAVIDSPASLKQLHALLRDSRAGRVHQNHPASTYRAYLKVNLKNEFFWLHCEVLQDAQGAVLVLKANTRNGTNPNGSSIYHLDRLTELLEILENNKTIESGPVNQPSR